MIPLPIPAPSIETSEPRGHVNDVPEPLPPSDVVSVSSVSTPIPAHLSSSLAKFVQRVQRGNSLTRTTRPKKPIPAPETTPVAKRTRSLKRSASLNDFDISHVDSPTLSDKSPDKTLVALKAKSKKKKQSSPLKPQ